MLFKENSAESLATQDCSKFCHWVAVRTCSRLFENSLNPVTVLRELG